MAAGGLLQSLAAFQALKLPLLVAGPGRSSMSMHNAKAVVTTFTIAHIGILLVLLGLVDL